MRVLALLALAAGIAAAQVADLTTNGDGSVAYFSTADLKIYQVNTAGVALYMERAPTDPTPPPMGQYSISNYFSLSRPEVSRDGKTVVFTGNARCLGGAHCNNAPLWQTTVIGAGDDRFFTGKGRISGNRRYLLTYEANKSPGFYATITDLVSGQTFDGAPYTPDSNAIGAGRVVADDGTVVYGESGLTLLRPGAVERVPSSVGTSTEAVIDSAAQVVVYTWRVGSARPVLRVYRIVERTVELLTDLPSSKPYISGDGSRVMFVSDASGMPQVYTVNIDGTSLRQVSHAAAGISLAAMSDDGRVAWYFAGDTRLYRMDLETGEAQERMGRSPQLFGPFASFSPGSTYSLAGSGFSDEAFTASAYPLPRSLGGVSVTVDGVPAPLYSVTPRQIVFQAPWNGGPSVSVVVHTGSTSPFMAQFVAKAVIGLAAFLPYVIHEDWGGLVTTKSRAVAGEVLHLYGTGLGRVEQAQADGVPAPADPPVRTVIAIRCSLSDGMDVPVLFAGLAPGLVGYYQIDLRLPATGSGASTEVTCTGEGGNPFQVSIPSVPLVR